LIRIGWNQPNTKDAIRDPFDNIISYLQDNQCYDEDNNNNNHNNGNNLKSEGFVEYFLLFVQHNVYPFRFGNDKKDNGNEKENNGSDEENNKNFVQYLYHK